MKSFLKTGIVLILISFTIVISAQEIKVTEFRSDLRDISARENVVYDANGDACALIKMRSGLQNLKFSSDLGILKTENHDGEYWLWVSPNTRKISIEAEEIGKLEYELPAYAEKYIVYVIFLTAVLPDKILYKSINSIRINTKPQNAEVYIDSTFMGFSPININTPSDSFRYKIQKRKFSPIRGYFVNTDLKKEIFIELKKDPEAKRMFFAVHCIVSKFGTPMGFQIGILGKTGGYISITPPLRTKKYIQSEIEINDYSFITMESKRFSSITGLPFGDYYAQIQDFNNTFFNHFRLKAGITQRVLKNTYLVAGLGWAKSTRYYRLNVIPYSNDPQLEIPLKKTFYGIGKNEINNLVLETGLSYRVSNSYLIYLNISTSGAQKNSFLPYNSFLPFEFSAGIGYNF